MAKRGEMKRKTDKDILNEYAMVYTEVMEVFGVSKQQAFQYLKGESRPEERRLRDVAIEYEGQREGVMAREMLRLRGFVLADDVEAVVA